MAKTKIEKPITFDEWLHAYKGFGYMYFCKLPRKQRENIKIEYGIYRRKVLKGEIKNYEL